MPEAFSGPAGPDLPPRRPGRPAPAELLARRAAGAAMAEQSRALGVEVASETLGGVACATCVPARPAGTIVHLHGGGFRTGSAAAWTPFGARLAAATGTRVVLPDYGLAPET